MAMNSWFDFKDQNIDEKNFDKSIGIDEIHKNS